MQIYHIFTPKGLNRKKRTARPSDFDSEICVCVSVYHKKTHSIERWSGQMVYVKEIFNHTRETLQLLLSYLYCIISRSKVPSEYLTINTILQCMRQYI